MPASAPTDFIPARFNAFIGGYMGPSYSVELRDGVLIYTTMGMEYTKTAHKVIQPSDSQWREFRQELDSINVWRWRSDYRNPGVCDGTGWALDVSYPDCALATKGDNNYPNASGKPSNRPNQTKIFNRLLQAIQKLIGRDFE